MYMHIDLYTLHVHCLTSNAIKSSLLLVILFPWLFETLSVASIINIWFLLCRAIDFLSANFYFICLYQQKTKKKKNKNRFSAFDEDGAERWICCYLCCWCWWAYCDEHFQNVVKDVKIIDWWWKISWSSLSSFLFFFFLLQIDTVRSPVNADGLVIYFSTFILFKSWKFVRWIEFGRAYQYQSQSHTMERPDSI